MVPDVVILVNQLPVLIWYTYPLIHIPESVASFQVNVILPVVTQLHDIGESNITWLGGVVSLVILTVLDHDDVFHISSTAFAVNVFVHSTNGVTIENIVFDSPLATTLVPLYISTLLPLSAVHVNVIVVHVIVCDIVVIIGVAGGVVSALLVIKFHVSLRTQVVPVMSNAYALR